MSKFVWCESLHVQLKCTQQQYTQLPLHIHKLLCNMYNMASRCVSAISDLKTEIVARGEADFCYRGVKGWYCWYTSRSHAIYPTCTSMLPDIYGSMLLFPFVNNLSPTLFNLHWLCMLRLMQSIMNIIIGLISAHIHLWLGVYCICNTCR